MKTRTKFSLQVPLIFLLATMLAACGSRTQFVAPEIEPPADLIPGYVPKGFELVKGYQIKPGDFDERRVFADAEHRDEDTRPICDLHLQASLFDLQSPSGNDILGIQYQDGDRLLLITKSYYPAGSLDLWRAAFGEDEEDARDCDGYCPCGCVGIALGRMPVLFRDGEIQDVRTVGGTQVAIVDQGLLGTITVFLREDYLLTVEGGISLEENLKIVASLLDD